MGASPSARKPTSGTTRCSCWPAKAEQRTRQFAPDAGNCASDASNAPPLLSAASRQVAGWEVLAAVLDIERRCSDPSLRVAEMEIEEETGEFGELVNFNSLAEASETCNRDVEVLLDDPNVRYCACGSPESSAVVAYLRVNLADTSLGDVWFALASDEERRNREPDSEYRVLREAEDGDPTREEVLTYIMRSPWPFWDREVLQKRWQLPLVDDARGLGIAIVMQSIEDARLLPASEESRIRAFVLKSACLLRPLNGETSGCGKGVEVTYVQQVDLGGRCPYWAQAMITRFAVQAAVRWAETLTAHCRRMCDQRSAAGWQIGDHWKTGGPLPAGTVPNGHADHLAGGSASPKALACKSPTAIVRSPSGNLPQPSGEGLLRSILAIERLCNTGEKTAGEEDLTVACLMDGPDTWYYMCASLSSPVVTGFISSSLPDVSIGDAWAALVTEEERLIRNYDSEYEHLVPASPDDASREEVLKYVMRAPRPFWDRDILQRRWQLALPCEDGTQGLAIVARSIEDDDLYPQRDDRVRAFAHKLGYLLRPMKGGGIHVVCSQTLDMGGLCPAWAQSFLTKMCVQRGQLWVTELQTHCNKMSEERRAEGRDIGDAWLPTAAKPAS